METQSKKDINEIKKIEIIVILIVNHKIIKLNNFYD